MGVSNHTHVVLRVDPRLPHAWDDEEVAARWNRLTRSLDGPVDLEAATVREQSLLQQRERLTEIRNRLGNPQSPRFTELVHAFPQRSHRPGCECRG